MKYITARQFIKKYGISKLTLSNWRKANKVNFIKIGLKSYLYDPDIKTTKLENTLHIQNNLLIWSYRKKNYILLL